jgi:hypothetical protein
MIDAWFKYGEHGLYDNHAKKFEDTNWVIVLLILVIWMWIRVMKLRQILVIKTVSTLPYNLLFGPHIDHDGYMSARHL